MCYLKDTVNTTEKHSRRSKGIAMIWIGTSGWVYPHWVGPFYPPDLPVREQLSYYARHFPTVEINRSFYRLPTYDQFHAWAEQIASHPGFLFAVKASRYLTHMKKLHNAEEGVKRLIGSASGLGEHLGPFLYQLPPRWHANPQRLEEFIRLLPRFHHGAHGIGLSDEELTFWAKRLTADAAEDREIYVYFNNDPEGYAVHDALRLRELVGDAAVLPS